MAGDLSFACDCGTVRGAIRLTQPVDGECITCHCHDCRDFVRLCGKQAAMLDDLGGVQLFNFRGSALTIAAGQEHIACLHMTDRPVLRWYASCCETPLFNSYATTRIPFFDIFREVLEDDTSLAGLVAAERHLFVQSATGDGSHLRHMSVAALLWRTAPRLLREYASGGRHRSPLFDPASGTPLTTPRRVTPSERSAIP